MYKFSLLQGKPLSKRHIIVVAGLSASDLLGFLTNPQMFALAVFTPSPSSRGHSPGCFFLGQTTSCNLLFPVGRQIQCSLQFSGSPGSRIHYEKYQEHPLLHACPSSFLLCAVFLFFPPGFVRMVSNSNCTTSKYSCRSCCPSSLRTLPLLSFLLRCHRLLRDVLSFLSYCSTISPTNPSPFHFLQVVVSSDVFSHRPLFFLHHSKQLVRISRPKRALTFAASSQMRLGPFYLAVFEGFDAHQPVAIFEIYCV